MRLRPVRDLQDASLARAALWCLAKLSSHARMAAVEVGESSDATELICAYTLAIVVEMLLETCVCAAASEAMLITWGKEGCGEKERVRKLIGKVNPECITCSSTSTSNGIHVAHAIISKTFDNVA